MRNRQIAGTWRAVVIVFIVCGVALGLCGIRWLLRLTRPTDGLMIGDYTQQYGQTGVLVYILPKYPLPIGFESGDVITAMNDRLVDDWGHDLFAPIEWGNTPCHLASPLLIRSSLTDSR